MALSESLYLYQSGVCAFFFFLLESEVGLLLSFNKNNDQYFSNKNSQESAAKTKLLIKSAKLSDPGPTNQQP